MGAGSMRLIVTMFFLVLCYSVIPALATTDFPSCVDISTDQDGDGFGFENSATCIVDESTRDITSPGTCIDDNADGYGWNGVETCIVEIVQNAECVDTAPVGDGWGWDGESSCRVFPLAAIQVSELELLKSKLIKIDNRDERNAAFFCPDTDETYYLFLSGFLSYFVGQDLVGEGMWSTGMFDLDNRLSTWVFGMNPRIARIDEQVVEFFNITTCHWFE